MAATVGDAGWAVIDEIPEIAALARRNWGWPSCVAGTTTSATIVATGIRMRLRRRRELSLVFGTAFTAAERRRTRGAAPTGFSVRLLQVQGNPGVARRRTVRPFGTWADGS